jgi:galactose-1-phosphate uridylyltransferase
MRFCGSNIDAYMNGEEIKKSLMNVQTREDSDDIVFHPKKDVKSQKKSAASIDQIELVGNTTFCKLLKKIRDIPVIK